MALLSDLIDGVIEECPGCSEPQAESRIRDVVIDFFKRSKLYSVDHAPISLIADTAGYALSNPTGYQILHVRSATLNGKPFRLVSEEQLDLEWHELAVGWSWRYQFSDAAITPSDDWRLAVSDLPGLGYQLDPNNITLVGIPTTAIADALKLKLVCFPTESVTTIPDWIYNTHHMNFRDGAIAWLKSMKDKPFSDRSGAEGFGALYEQAVLDAAARSLGGMKRNDQQQRRTKVWR